LERHGLGHINAPTVEQPVGLWGFGPATSGRRRFLDAGALGRHGVDRQLGDDPEPSRRITRRLKRRARRRLGRGLGAISHWNGARWTQIQYGFLLPFLVKVHGPRPTTSGPYRSADGKNSGVILHLQP
jgi:hypothetical protein